MDADPKSVSQLCTTLSDAGWATLGGDCEAALHGAASFRADVIVLDVSLPDCAMDVICQAIRRDLPAVAVLLTAPPDGSGASVRARFVRDGLLLKPIAVPALFEVLNEALDARAARLVSLHASAGMAGLDRAADNRRR